MLAATVYTNVMLRSKSTLPPEYPVWATCRVDRKPGRFLAGTMIAMDWLTEADT